MMSETPRPIPIPLDVIDRAADTLRVLAHPHRLRIVEYLMVRQFTVGQLADILSIPPNACSQHLNLMRAHGLLRSSRNGKEVYYQVDNPHAVQVIECLRKHESVI
jgi:DNA-binding transcriptional ArsR family regulator